jgi:hypothetical protein
MPPDPSIDSQLSAWRERMTTISRNLMELNESESTRAIRNQARNPGRPYEGLTASQVREALDALDALWQDYLVLSAVIDRATELGRRSGVFHDYGREIQELLAGPSVELPAVNVPMPDRGLLDSAERKDKMTPGALLEAMLQAFARARDVLTRVAQAQSQSQPRIEALEKEAAALGDLARSLGEAPDAAGPGEDLLSRAAADPLALARDVDEAAARLARRREALDALAKERGKVEQGLGDAAQVLQELGAVLVGSRDALVQAREKILEPEGLSEPMDDAGRQGLADWLDTLRTTFAGGRWRAAKVGLDRWGAAADAALAAERQRLAANRAALDERAELQGRFKALRAKGDALARRGPVPPGLPEAAREAEAALQARPFDLPAGRRLVSTFESLLAGKPPTLPPSS